MAAAAAVRAQGRALEERLRRAPGRELLAALRAAGELSAAEAAALGPPGGRSWARRLRALALARGETACRALLRGLAALEEPGPFDFYNPRRDAEPSHRSDCPCCRPAPGGGKEEEEEEEEEGRDPREEDGDPKDEEEHLEEEEGDPEEEEGDLREEEGRPEDEEGDVEEETGDPEEEEEAVAEAEDPAPDDDANSGPETD